MSDDAGSPGGQGADDPQVIDYELDDLVSAESPERMRALSDPLRYTICDLVLERAMSVTELAERVDRPRGTVAYHVDILVEAGLLKVVRTRRVRAVEERFYGRVARTFMVYKPPGDLPFLADVMARADLDRHDVPSGFTFRRARIPRERAEEYRERLFELSLEFSAEPRSGDTEYAVYVGLFPTTQTFHRRSPDHD